MALQCGMQVLSHVPIQSTLRYFRLQGSIVMVPGIEVGDVILWGKQLTHLDFAVELLDLVVFSLHIRLLFLRED